MNDRDYLLQNSRSLSDAQLAEAIEQRPLEIQTITLDLTTARSEFDPFEFKQPFRSFFVRSASDTATVVKFRPDSTDSIQSPIDLKINDSMDFGRPIARGFFHWDAQPGRKMQIVLLSTGVFRSGTQISQNAGGVSINDGSSVTGPLSTTLAAATAAVIAPAKLDRKVATLQNKSGADIYIAGDNTVTASGATEGIKITNGQIFSWRNTAALYGYSVAGGAVGRIEEA
jgi:hypothetical protein